MASTTIIISLLLVVYINDSIAEDFDNPEHRLRCGGPFQFTITNPPITECTRPNEEYQCGSACQTACATLGQECPIVNVRCNDACYCKEGYARDFSGTCIPIKHCPPVINCTRPYEECKCGSACQTECATLGQTCPIVNKKCNEGCYCIEGYARDSSGRCIPIKECPAKTPPPVICTRPFEEYQCGSACQTTCQTLGQICPIVNIRCNDDCYCIKGYARDYIGNCIPIKQCPPPIICSKPNEEYQCGSACQTECATLGQVCPIVNVRCNDGCYCKNGYARDSKGYCIPIKYCPPIILNPNCTHKG